jgi:F-type H+-transporting ATPase subunit gamma
MSDTNAGLRRKIYGAKDLLSVVSTMKVVAASSIVQYEQSVAALGDYYRTVEIGLCACLRQSKPSSRVPERKKKGAPGAIVFGSDQGLVGQFNDTVADFAAETLATLPGKPVIWAVGERVHARLVHAGLPPLGLFPVPHSVKAITPLVRQILMMSETRHSKGEISELNLFYHQTSGAAYTPVRRHLLPLDETWRNNLLKLPWPTKSLPEILGPTCATLQALVRGYLFVSLFRACAESLASENASRLAAMQRAEKNIRDVLDELTGTFHRLRQSSIDEELFDVISGFEALPQTF